MKKNISLIIILIMSLVFIQNMAHSQDIYLVAYLNRLQNKVKSNWILPHGQNDKKTIIQFIIDNEGKIENSKIIRSSGDQDFDNTALTSISKSAPFEHFSDNLKEEKMTICFTFTQDSLDAVQILDKPSIEKKFQTINQFNLNSNDDINTTIDNVNFKPYLKSLQEKIKSNWNPPNDAISKKNLFLFKILKDGSLSNLKLLQTSGHQNYDQQALIAINKSAPFDPLPNEFSKKSIDVQFTFDYNALAGNDKKISINNKIEPKKPKYKPIIPLWYIMGMATLPIIHH